MGSVSGIVCILACWFFLGVGVLIGHFAWPRPEVREVVSTAPAEPAPAEPVYTAPRGAHHGPPTTEFQIPPELLAELSEEPPSPEPRTGPMSLPVPPLDPHPVQGRRRRADDRPGVEPAAPQPGGRRRSDEPPMTRQQARQLRETGRYDP